ncbi:MAG: hypothetical protein WBQ60_07915 [Asticcacaulis sp.]
MNYIDKPNTLLSELPDDAQLWFERNGRAAFNSSARELIQHARIPEFLSLDLVEFIFEAEIKAITEMEF